MPKAVALSDDMLASAAPQPKAAQIATMTVALAKPRKEPKEPVVPLQIRIPARDLKAIKLAAVEADQNVSDFMLTCFHAYIKK